MNTKNSLLVLTCLLLVGLISVVVVDINKINSTNQLATVISNSNTTPSPSTKVLDTDGGTIGTEAPYIAPTSVPRPNTGCSQGNGTVQNPYQICTVQDLRNVGNDMDAHYSQINDIDLTGINFEPIGGATGIGQFNGVYNGNGRAIRGLTINLPNSSGIGLFKYITTGEISNLSLIDVNITGNYDVGGLVGFMNGNAKISGVNLTNANITGKHTVGGLVGSIGPSSQVPVIENCTVSGVVRSTVMSSWSNVGGLVGNIASPVQIKNCTVNAGVQGNFADIGGFVGHLERNAVISDSTVYGTVNGKINTGGFVGRMSAGDTNTSPIIKNSKSFSNVTGEDEVGGFVGNLSDAEISNSSSYGSVIADYKVGGFVGYMFEGLANAKSIIKNSFAKGNVVTSGTHNYVAGGFAGAVVGSKGKGLLITNSSSGGYVVSPGGKCVGGFVGQMTSSVASAGIPPTIRLSYSKGSVNGTQSVGGFAGLMTSAGSGSPCLTAGTSLTVIEDSYSSSHVVGNSRIGGFAGASGAVGKFKLTNVYSKGYVGGAGVNPSYIGGLIGKKNSADIVTNSYWNKQTSSQNTSAGGESRTTTEMTSVPRPSNTYTGFDFSTYWTQQSGFYPLVQTINP